MQSLYIDGGRAGKRQIPKKPNLRLAGTAHRPGWPVLVRAFRAQLKALRPRSPVDVRGHERAALEVIEYIDHLDPKSLHLFRVAFAELIKLSK
jgi:hypothetical protein